MVVLALVALCVGIAAAVNALPMPTAQVGVQAYLGEVLWFVISLPLAVMAWTLPDPEPDPQPEA